MRAHSLEESKFSVTPAKSSLVKGSVPCCILAELEVSKLLSKFLSLTNPTELVRRIFCFFNFRICFESFALVIPYLFVTISFTVKSCPKVSESLFDTILHFTKTKVKINNFQKLSKTLFFEIIWRNFSVPISNI